MKRWALAAAWLALCVPAPAFAVDGASSPFIVDVWDNEGPPGKRLPDNEVISVIQTRDGYLWLGTLHGLVRFDGNHFTVFNQMNTPGLTSDRIVYLFEDSRTNLWAGTESSGLCRIYGGAVENFSTAGAAGKIIYAEEDEAGAVWFCTDGGKILAIRNGKIDLNSAKLPLQLYYRALHLKLVGTKDAGWNLQEGRVQKLRGGQVEKDFGVCPWPMIPIIGLFRSGAGMQPIQFDQNIITICCDTDGNLIVGTRDSGVFWSGADGKFRQISIADGLSSKTVLSVCVDLEGNLWVGTDGGGLNRIKRKMFNSPAVLRAGTAQSVSADTNGGLWVAFNAAGISYLSPSNTADNFAIGPASNAWTVVVTTQQQVWAGTRDKRDEGLFQFNENHFVPAPSAAILGPQIFALLETRAGELWAGTERGLAHLDGTKWKLFMARDGLNEDSIRAIAEDSRGGIWIGTENRGLNYFKDGKFISYRTGSNGLPGDDISCLYVDHDSVLWVGTAGHGLARLVDGKWNSFSAANGLASDNISYIAEDDTVHLWIGSNAGLMRVGRKSFDEFVAGKVATISCRTYGKADGLPTRECSAGSQPAVARTAEGRLWFPTTKGVVSVDPSELKPNLQPPAVMIESVLVDGREQKTNQLTSSWRQSITIPPGGEELEIHYTALNFSAPELVRFKCWLEGHEARPTEVGGERIARYPKLPPGAYHFHVSACNEDGVWNEAGSVLEITVQPHFWQTTGFHIATIIVALTIIVAGVRYASTQKLQRQLQAHQQREALEHERARIARDLHDQLGANLTQVALLGEMAGADKHAPEEIESHAQQISQTARETTRSLDEIVWAINPANDTLEGLANYAFKYAQEFLALAGIRCRLDAPAQLPAITLPPEVRHNVFLAFKEAVNNVVKHAQAGKAQIRLRLQPEYFIFEIEDDGKGVSDLNSKQNRNGLRNMRQRTENIRGSFEIAPATGRGTIVRLTVPLGKK